MKDSSKMILLHHWFGFTNEEISNKLGYTRTKVSDCIRKGRKYGHVPKFRPKIVPEYENHVFYRKGSISDILNDLSREQRTWVVNSAQKEGCLSVAEYITEIVRDAHAEQCLT